MVHLIIIFTILDKFLPPLNTSLTDPRLVFWTQNGTMEWRGQDGSRAQQKETRYRTQTKSKIQLFQMDAGWF